MGCLFSLCKKNNNNNSSLNQPLDKTNDDIKDNILANNDISISVNDPKSTENNNENKDIPTNINESKEYDDSKTIYSEKGLNLNENIGDDEPLLRADSPLICDYEKGVITFTKNGFIKLFDELWVLDNYKSVYDQNDLIIELRYEGTPMNDKFYLIRSSYKFQKSELKYNKDVDSFIDYCYDVNLRMMWDESLKLFEKYEGNDYN